MVRALVGLAVVVLSVSVAGCGGSSGNDGGSGGGSGGGAGPNDVTGHRNQVYRLESGDLVRPEADLSTYVALTTTTSDLTQYPFVKQDDGGFLIPSIPIGTTYYAQLSVIFYIASNLRDIDLDDLNNLGRPDLETAPATVPVTLTANNLSPTIAPEVLVVTPATGFYAEGRPDSPPTNPATSLTAAAATLSGTYGALPDGTSGDTTWVYQRLIRDGGDPLDGGEGPYLAADRFATLTALALTPDGGTLSATFGNDTLKELDVSFATAAYASHATELNPSATPSQLEVSLYPNLAGPNLPSLWVGYAGSLLDFVGQNFSDAPLGFSYADGYPDAWQRIVRYEAVFEVPAMLPGTTIGTSSAFIGDSRLLGDIQVPFQPRLSPVQSFFIDGSNAFNGGTLIGYAPTLTWIAPKLGTPTNYLVSVYKLTAVGDETRRYQVAAYETSSTSLLLTSDLLDAMSSYIFVVTAEMTPGHDLTQHPLEFVVAIDVAQADCYSGIWNTK